MKSLYCHVPSHCQGDLHKIETNIYWNEHTKQFFRISFLPEVTLLADENAVRSEFLTLLDYNPVYLVIQSLFQKKAMQENEIPGHLKHLDWVMFAATSTRHQQTVYEFDQKKVFNFLEQKTDQLNHLIASQILGLMIEKRPGDQKAKTISQAAEEFLLNELPQNLVSQFIKDRYVKATVTIKSKPQPLENQIAKKKSKSKPKVAEVKRDHNQPTLSFGKAKK